MFNIKLLTGIFPYLFLKQLNNAGYSAGNPAIGQTRYPVFRVTRYGICQNQYCGAIIVDGGKYYWGKWENGEQLVQNIFFFLRGVGAPLSFRRRRPTAGSTANLMTNRHPPQTQGMLLQKKNIFLA